MDRVNNTTKQSELNNIRKDLRQIKASIAKLTNVINKVVYYEAKETPSPVVDNCPVNAVINSLSESMDVLLDQMLQTQEQMVDANTITITRKLKRKHVNASVEHKDGKNVVIISFEVEPQNSGQIALTIDNNTKLTLFVNFKRRAIYTDNSAYDAFMSLNKDHKHVITVMASSTNANTINNVWVESVDLSRVYEFEQDAFMTFCVQYFDSNDERFFPTLIQSVQEVEN